MPAVGTTRQPWVREGTAGRVWPRQLPSPFLPAPGGQRAVPHLWPGGSPHPLSSRRPVTSPAVGAAIQPPARGAASDQVLQVHLGDRLSPVAEGAELRAWEGGILFLVEKWEHVFHELAQPVVPGSGEDTYCASAPDLRA